MIPYLRNWTLTATAYAAKVGNLAAPPFQYRPMARIVITEAKEATDITPRSCYPALSKVNGSSILTGQRPVRGLARRA